MDSQPQEIVEANKSIIQLLNCQNLWIEAFINETDASKLVVGQQAQINLNNSSNVQWKGRVETIRAGYRSCLSWAICCRTTARNYPPSATSTGSGSAN
ncbi:HlyD family efflux transporter periplasmic adaptor subunit [Nostoc sp.]|uniref:HlyD family efflux transporter periplasmic adaptor subunit n=1 Tax=Nostoc sp. TaxID=1180 RepID=UPI003FA55F0C